MNKTFKVVISAFVISALIWLWVIPFNAVEIKRYYGDINNDGYLTTQDAKTALLIATGIYKDILTAMDTECADIDHDGKITSKDARDILRASSGVIKKEFMQGYEFDESPAEFLKRVNQIRLNEDSENSKLTLSQDLCNVAKIAAEEFANETGSAFVRKDGSFYYDLLDENGIKYTYADKIIVVSSFGYKEACDKMAADIQGKKALCNENFKNFGVGAYTKDGQTFYWCVYLTK